MDLEQLAKRQLSDYDRHRPGSLFGQSISMTVDQAYALQMAVAELRVRRGEPIAGYKVGCLSPAVQAQLGLNSPAFGHIFATEIHASGAVLNPDDFDGLAVEGEFAVRIARDIPNADWLRDHAAAAVASWFAVIELHNYVFRRAPPTAQELIGNNAIHAGVVMPPSPPALADPAGLAEAVVQVSKNGTTLGTASVTALPEGPLGSLARLAAHLEEFGQYLRQGDLVLTGSPLPLYRVSAGDRIEVRGGPTEPVVATIASTDSRK